MEGTPYIPLPEADFDKPDDKKDKKKSKSRHAPEALGVAATRPFEKSAEAKPERLAEKSTETKEVKQDAGSAPEVATETAAPLEELSEEEATTIRSQLAQEAKRQLPPEPEADPDPEKAAGDLAVENMLDDVIEGKTPQAAYEDRLAELGVDPAEVPKEVDSTTETSDKPLLETEPPAPDDETLMFDRSAEAEPSADESDLDEEPSASVGGSGSIPPPPPPTGRSGGSPAGPAGPGRPFGAVPPAAPPAAVLAAGAGPGLNPNVAPATPIEYVDTGRPAADLLIGGIIGYLIGRRRGRIKTERRLKPIQKKLESQVSGLRRELELKQQQLRQAATRQVRRDGPLVVEKLKQSRAKPRPAPEKPVLVAAKETLPTESLPERRLAPAAHQLHGEQAPTRIGSVLVAAEALAPARRDEQVKKRSTEISSQETARIEPPNIKQVQTLNRAELLEYSQKIEVDGTSLRQIYETHLVGERGLRRLVAEHLRGGDLKKALRREIVEREIDFERDPALRDMAVPTSAAGPVGATGLNQLLKKAESTLPAGGDSEKAAFYKARADYEAGRQHKQHKQRVLVDWVLSVVVLLLIAAVIVLYLTRG